MTELSQYEERRSEVRLPASAERISWARKDAVSTTGGWLSDVATSSISFVTPTRDSPVPGDAIELTLNASGRSPQHRSVRVARTAPHDRLLSLVACRTDATSQQRHAV